MIDINQYTYTKVPFNVNEKFVTHPLSDDGIKQYFSKEAHTHTYLDKLNPRKMESIYQEKNELDDYMRTILEKRETKRMEKLGITTPTSQNNIQQDHQNEVTMQSNQIAKEQIYDSETFRQIPNNNQQDKPMVDNKNESKEGFYTSIRQREGENVPANNNDKIRSRTTNNFYRGGNTQVIKNTNNSSNNNNGYAPYFNTNNKLGSNSYSKRFQPQRLDEKLMCFGNSNFGKRVKPKLNLTSFHKIKPTVNHTSKYSMNEDQVCPKISEYYLRPGLKIGFESYNIPRVEGKKTKLKPLQVSQFDKKCYNSLSGFFDSKSNNFYSYLNGENDRLTNILLNQTNEGFLRDNKLPKISYIVNQPEIIVKRTGIGNSKFMGPKYNPFNFNPANNKNLTKRNINGALFLH